MKGGESMRWVWLDNFEGDGKPVRVSLKVLIKMPKKIAGRIGRKFQKQLIRRNNARRKMASEMEEKQES